MPECTIVHTARFPAMDPARKGKEDVIVLYQTDTGLVRTLRLPAESFTPDKVKEACKADLATHKALVGMKFTT